jgi:hypothetical protein
MSEAFGQIGKYNHKKHSQRYADAQYNAEFDLDNNKVVLSSTTEHISILDELTLNEIASYEQSFPSFSGTQIPDAAWVLANGGGSGESYWTSGSTGTGSIKTVSGDTVSTGNYSVAEGFQTTASGNYSHAEGNTTKATNGNAHSEGYFTVASGESAHAEGINTIAGGNYSHAEGYYAKATGGNSHAEGNFTIASADNTHAEGEGTTAAGYSSHAEGSYTEALGNQSHAEGNYSKASGNQSHAEGSNTTASNDLSHAEGYYTTASGYISHAEGNTTKATGANSHSEGRDTIAQGTSTHAEGRGTTAIGQNSHAEGNDSVSTGEASHAEGIATQAIGAYSHTEGYVTTASGQGSHAEGNTTKASGNYSHAEGTNTTTSGLYAHAEGSYTTASGQDAHAEGDSTQAIGQDSHAENEGTIARGEQSHAEGRQTVANGQSSHSEGYQTTANGQNSHVGGDNVTANGVNSFIHSKNSIINSGSTNSVILGGSGNTITSGVTNTIVLGSNLTGTTSNTVYINKLNAKDLPAKTSETDILYINASGTVSKGTAPVVPTITQYWTGGTGINSIQTIEGGNDASGNYSIAMGQGTISSGTSSHSEGGSTVAIGAYSHAEGNTTTASGYYSHSEGQGTIASGDSTHAEGGNTQAIGIYSHAEGASTIASGQASHAEGNTSTAEGNYSHAEGSNNQSIGEDSHTEGNGNIATTSSSHVEGQLNLTGWRFIEVDSVSSGLITISDGIDYTSYFANGFIYATNAGNYKYEISSMNYSAPNFTMQVTDTSLNSIGGISDINSVSEYATLIYGYQAHAEGQSTKAIGHQSHAEGQNNIAFGDQSHAEGNGNISGGYQAHVEGQNNIASGGQSHAQGYGNVASGYQSHAEGSNNTAAGTCSHVGGQGNQVLGYNGFVANGSGNILGSNSSSLGLLSSSASYADMGANISIISTSDSTGTTSSNAAIIGSFGVNVVNGGSNYAIIGMQNTVFDNGVQSGLHTSDAYLNKLAFRTGQTVSNQGEVIWDDHDLTLKVKSKGATLSVNQETTLAVKNETGSPLLNGKLVRITGYDDVNDYFTVEYSDCSSATTAFVDGVLTEEIAVGEVGLMTYQGIVNDLDTSTGTENGIVYLGTNGDFTNVEPSFPNTVLVIGKFGEINASTGNIFVSVSSQLTTTINNLQHQIDLKATQNPGICQMRPLYANDIVIDTTGLTLTIATVKSGQTISASNPVVWYTDGSGVITKWYSNIPITFTFTNTTGTWFFYLDNNGQAIATQTPWSDFNIIAPIFILDWDATLSGSARLIEEQIEMHSNSIEADTHAHFHFNDGCININSTGDLIRNELTTGQPNIDGRNTCISLTNTTNQDDNLTYTITNCHPNTATAYFEQDMGITTAGSLTSTNAGLFPIRTNSAGGQRSFLPATRFPFKWNTGNNRPQYITTAGVATDVTDNRYFVYYVYALQDRKTGQAMRLVSAEVDFTTLALAQAHSFATLQGLYADLRNNEIRPMYKLIFLADNAGGGAFNVAVKYTRLHQVVDIRKTVALTITSTAGITPATNVTTAVGGYGNQESLNENVTFGPLSAITNSIPTYADTTGKVLKDANAVYIDGNILKVNTTVANTNTGVRLHVSNGASGAPFTGSSTSYQAVLENNGDSGLQFSAPSANIHRVMFGSETDQIRGMIRYSNADNSMRFYNFNTSVQERLTILNSGFVGIGQSTPLSRLHTYGSEANQIIIERSTNSNAAMTFKNTLGETVIGRPGGSNIFGIGTSADFSSTGSTALVVTNTNNIGIGIITPVPETASNRIVHIHNTTANGSEIVLSNSATGSLVSDGLLLQCGSGGIGYLWNRENQPLVFGTNNGERMRINTTGLGIGTNNPSEKLHVIGNILSNANIKGATATFTTLPTAGTGDTQMVYYNPTTGDLSKGSIPSGSGSTSYTGGTGINISGNTIRVDVVSLPTDTTPEIEDYLMYSTSGGTLEKVSIRDAVIAVPRVNKQYHKYAAGGTQFTTAFENASALFNDFYGNPTSASGGYQNDLSTAKGIWYTTDSVSRVSGEIQIRPYNVSAGNPAPVGTNITLTLNFVRTNSTTRTVVATKTVVVTTTEAINQGSGVNIANTNNVHFDGAFTTGSIAQGEMIGLSITCDGAWGFIGNVALSIDYIK